MRMYNAIISNNQSKDLIASRCLHVKSKTLHSRLHAVSNIRACHIIDISHEHFGQSGNNVIKVP